MDQEKISRIREELEAEGADIPAIGEKYHPAEIAEAIDRIEDGANILRVFHALGPETAAEALIHLDDRARELVVEELSAARLSGIIEELDSDDAADILAETSEARAEDILRIMSEEAGEEVTRLMEYEEDTAGHLMQTELLSVPSSFTVAETIDRIRALAEEVQDIHNVFVTDGAGRLTGAVPVNRLILARPDVVMENLVEGEPIYVTADADQERVAELFKRYDIVSLPVVGPDMTLLGRILIDDVVDVLEEEADEDIMIMAGANDEALVQTRSAAEMARYRLPWLGTTMAGGVITGSLIWYFSGAISHVIAIASFIPVVMGIGGNVGSQSSALVIRGMATGRIDPGSLRRYFARETIVGIILGAACGAVALVVTYLWQGSAALGVVVALSMLFSITLAAVLGIVVPLFFRWARIDPAIAGGPIVLMINDITGLAVFLTLATALLHHLK